MKNVFLVQLLVFASIFVEKTCDAQILQFGSCVKVEPMKYFNLDKFLGKWYEVERFPNWYEDNGHCAFKWFEECERRIEVKHSFVREGVQYILHINTSFVPGDEAVFSFQESNIDPIGIPLTVVNTDYSNYAIVYGCKFGGGLGIKYLVAWILSREPVLPEEILQKARSELNAIPSASLAYLETVNHSEQHCMHHWTATINAEDTHTVKDDE